jgi:hypothetical protein
MKVFPFLYVPPNSEKAFHVLEGPHALLLSVSLNLKMGMEHLCN